MPQDWTSHVAPGATDYVNVQMNCDGGAYSVHVGDTLGFSYTFVLTSQPH